METKSLSFNKKQKISNNATAFAEIIESNLNSFTAQCWQWDFFPEFASLVQSKNQNRITLGIVTQIKTGSMDPMRYPFTYQKTESELLAEQPQIFEFLKTTFTVQIVGYIEKKLSSKINYILPSTPCKIHSFVQHTNENLESQFLQNSEFIHILFEYSNQILNIDELLLAILKKIKNKNQLTNQKIQSFCKMFSLLTGNDYRRLKLFLKRIENM